MHFPPLAFLSCKNGEVLGLHRWREQPQGRESRKREIKSSNEMGSAWPLGKRKPLLRSSHADCSPAFVPLPDMLMLLMTDVLVFLQEKDQKYIFPTLVRLPPPFSAQTNV